jgi:photosystem II stability/assembly factor-like uncharacterized protein
MSRLPILLLVALVCPPALGQDAPRMTSDVRGTPADDRREAVSVREGLREASVVRNVEFRNVGPTVMSGRVADLDVRRDDPTHFFVAYASGGLWKTETGGLSFKPLFDRESVMTIGDIAVDWERDILWVGTGEKNSSRSSYAGDGLYRSTDGGRTWGHRGLEATQHTGRIVLHPDDPDVLWVAAVGRLYGPSDERGVYKSEDGGATWRKVLFVDDDTGAIDLLAEPGNPDVLYAAMWHRERRAWNFVESGPGSGIYKSTDGGESWTLVTVEGSGFPTGDGVGRIGLDIHAGSPGILFALVDNQYRQPPEEEEEAEGLTRDALREMSAEAFEAVEDSVLEAFLRDNDFPDRYDAAGVKAMVRDGRIAPVALVEYLEDANEQLFDTDVIGAEVYRSDDGGATWTKTHDDLIEGLYNTYGYYFGEIRVAHDTPDRLYILGVPLLRSLDGGATWASIDAANMHVDHQALWVNPDRVGHLVAGNDGGVNISWDDGGTWFKANTPAVGQFYAVQVDEAEPYNVYGGLQDNGVWVGPSTYEASYGWYDDGRYPYERLVGGDGMQVEVDTRTNDLVYTGSQFGFYGRISRPGGERLPVRPRHELGERPLRFNWQSPIHLSRHNQDILYFGANRLYRSLDRGETLEPISGDLTGGGRPGDVPYGTLATIDESPMRFGLLYVGSDDGLVHVSRDGGHSWQRISDRLPQDLWASRVEASAHAEGRVYVSLNGYRWDHFDPYVYRSEDYGATWTRIDAGLPKEPVNVVTEDPHNEDILYVGTDHAAYVTLDRGTTWMAMGGGMPSAPVHDIKVQARERDLVVGTHGRSIWIADVGLVEQLTPEMMAREVHAFEAGTVTWSERWGDRTASWREPVQPSVEIGFWAGSAGTATIHILSAAGTVLAERRHEADRGLNFHGYDLTAAPDSAAGLPGPPEPADDGNVYLPPGDYTVRVTIGEGSSETALKVEERRRDR